MKYNKPIKMNYKKHDKLINDYSIERYERKKQEKIKLISTTIYDYAEEEKINFISKLEKLLAHYNLDDLILDLLIDWKLFDYISSNTHMEAISFEMTFLEIGWISTCFNNSDVKKAFNSFYRDIAFYLKENGWKYE